MFEDVELLIEFCLATAPVDGVFGDFLLGGVVKAIEVKLKVPLALLLLEVFRVSVFCALFIDGVPCLSGPDDQDESVDAPHQQYENGQSLHGQHANCEAQLVVRGLILEFIVGDEETGEHDQQQLGHDDDFVSDD